MVSFESDYIAGAHPEVLRRLTETNSEPLPGYGSDRYCESAKEKIRNAAGIPDAEIAFLSGGTQANAVVISSMLADYEAAISAPMRPARSSIPATRCWNCRRRKGRSRRKRWRNTFPAISRTKTASI